MLSLCRPKYDAPKRHKQIEQVKKIYNQMQEEDMNIPSLMRYQAYRATNVANIKLNPSSFIDRDVYVSMEELKNFKF